MTPYDMALGSAFEPLDVGCDTPAPFLSLEHAHRSDWRASTAGYGVVRFCTVSPPFIPTAGSSSTVDRATVRNVAAWAYPQVPFTVWANGTNPAHLQSNIVRTQDQVHKLPTPLFTFLYYWAAPCPSPTP